MKSLALALVLVLALAACTAPKPPQPTGDWVPVNQAKLNSGGAQ